MINIRESPLLRNGFNWFLKSIIIFILDFDGWRIRPVIILLNLILAVGGLNFFPILLIHNQFFLAQLYSNFSFIHNQFLIPITSVVYIYIYIYIYDEEREEMEREVKTRKKYISYIDDLGSWSKHLPSHQTTSGWGCCLWMYVLIKSLLILLIKSTLIFF